MLKKMLIAGGALALLSSLSIGVPFWSYAKCGFNSVSTAASDAMPLEWELKRARQMIHDLQPEIEANAHRIAREKVETARLAKQLEDTESRLAKSKSDIARLHDDLQQDSVVYAYGGRTYTSAQVKADLTNRAKRHQTRQATADKLRQMLSAREASLQAAQQQMDAMLNARRQLEVEVENLQARMSALRVAQTNSQLNLDDSRLAQTRDLLDEIATRIDVQEETLAVDVEYFGEIDLDQPTEADLDALVSSILKDDPSVDEEKLVSIQLD
ncbi:hypothetical protein [Crateriforma conspicua]|uniref:Chromosome partition protein Smc n=1 Tax=Crateriforma conspicua TaxID=2527996 RepID=A0A5C6FL48_9PLAN|nr:hypothetical protein [Crateriforma conspicua]TWU62945.1 Chromosome partition protein Smc [Crateriforma conspicua]